MNRTSHLSLQMNKSLVITPELSEYFSTMETLCRALPFTTQRLFPTCILCIPSDIVINYTLLLTDESLGAA